MTASPEPGQARLTRLPVVVALVAVALRLPLLENAASPDEAGFLTVAGQWHAGGSSLYGNYWVDRPPLLISLFRLAALAGGLVPLRLLGCLAVALIVLGTAHVARRLGGPRASVWAAVVAGAWLVNPLLGAEAVNGELLSAPFVVWGIAAAIHGLAAERPRRAVLMAAASGAALVAALLVKQNIADVAVFAAVAGLLAWRRHEITGGRLLQLGSGFAVGGLAGLGTVSLWTVLHGTSLAGVLDAMYAFRIAAGRVLAHSPSHAATGRFGHLLVAWLIGGGVVVMLLVLWALVSRRLVGTVVWALAATSAFDVVSVLAGGNYWNHYLVQLVMPLAALMGLLAARHRIGARTVVVTAAVLALGAWVVGLPSGRSSIESAVGRSIAAQARPGDTIVTLYGHSDVDQSSGLPSPYPYLWSLPTKTRDPDLRLLDKILGGPSAPTWFVTWKTLETWGIDSVPTSRLIAQRYHRVRVMHGHSVYLRNGVQRHPPFLLGADQSGSARVVPSVGAAEAVRTAGSAS